MKNSEEVKENVRNDTKNIPKNFGKAIISFVQRNDRIIKKFLSDEKTSYHEYVAALKARKKNLNSIADLRALWVDG